MRYQGRRSLLAVLAALAVPATARGQYDPRYAWRTIDTPHFQLHFHQGEERLAERCASAAERAHALLAPLLGHVPFGRTQIVLSDDTDEANGSATVLPYNTVRLFAPPPPSLSELNNYRDWVFSLVAHEYFHILHMDTIEGLPRLGNAVFGKLFAPNGALPPWMIEGLAVLHESSPGAGRNESALFDMYARAMVMEGRVPRIDQASNQPLDWPIGHSSYLLGGRFFAFLRDRYGPDAIAGFVRDQGAMVWPYAPSWAGARHFGGQSFAALWSDFEESLRQRYAEQLAAIRRRPATRAAQLTRRGGEVHHPRWSPDGAFLAYYDQGLEGRAGLRRVSPDGRDLGRFAAVEGNGTLALRSPGQALVAASDLFQEYRVYGDLYLVDLGTGQRTRLTFGERATDPDVLPEGGSVVYVAHTAPGEHALRRLRLDGGPPETLFERAGAQIYLPRISPDGQRVAFELQENGRRDIAIWTDGSVVRLTHDDAIDVSPEWAPDGRRLFFASDRGGVYNLYAWEPAPSPPTSGDGAGGDSPPVAAGTLRQVTNAETGAFQPAVSPDGRTLAFVTYTSGGYDLASLPIEPGAWLEPPPDEPRPRDPDEAYDPSPGYPSRPYPAWETLGPTFWLPVLFSDAAGLAPGAFTAGGDVVGLHRWAAQAFYSQAKDVDYSLAYLGAWMHPRLGLGSSRFIGNPPNGASSQLEAVWTPISVALVFPNSHLDRAHAISLGWRARLYRALTPFDPASGAQEFKDGTLSELSLGLSYGDAQRFVHSISPEEGRLANLTLRFAAPSIGSDFSYASAQASISQYLRLPWTAHWVVGARLSLGGAAGTLGGRLPFQLGGIPPPDLLALLLGGAAGPADLLRGYPSGLFAGTVLVSGNLELRFPLFAPARGYSTWPLFLRRVHGALFLDTGTVFTPSEGSGPGVSFRALDSLRFGAGAELRFEVVAGYYLRTDVRLGFAQGLGKLLASPRPADPYARTQVYLTIGPSF